VRWLTADDHAKIRDTAGTSCASIVSSAANAASFSGGESEVESSIWRL